MPDQHFEPLEEAIDPFLAALNAQCIGPGDYAAELVVNSTLNRQQILAVAPIAWVMEQMWLNRSNPQSPLADGAASESCNCLWLGAGAQGSRLKPPRFVAKQIGISGALLKPWRACSKPCWRCWPCAAEVR